MIAGAAAAAEPQLRMRLRIVRVMQSRWLVRTPPAPAPAGGAAVDRRVGVDRRVPALEALNFENFKFKHHRFGDSESEFSLHWHRSLQLSFHFPLAHQQPLVFKSANMNGSETHTRALAARLSNIKALRSLEKRRSAIPALQHTHLHTKCETVGVLIVLQYNSDVASKSQHA
jgi:hypothetical protein